VLIGTLPARESEADVESRHFLATSGEFECRKRSQWSSFKKHDRLVLNEDRSDEMYVMTG
jgi:hypothetical protein